MYSRKLCFMIFFFVFCGDTTVSDRVLLFFSLIMGTPTVCEGPPSWDSQKTKRRTTLRLSPIETITVSRNKSRNPKSRCPCISINIETPTKVAWFCHFSLISYNFGLYQTTTLPYSKIAAILNIPLLSLNSNVFDTSTWS